MVTRPPIIDATTTLEEFERELENAGEHVYILRLYVSGSTPRSSAAVVNIKRICERHLPGRYELEVIDLYQSPELARSQQLVAAPTLVKQLPMPVRRLVGDLSNEERVLISLDIRRVP
jgi:circadian clock protein KaiB